MKDCLFKHIGVYAFAAFCVSLTSCTEDSVGDIIVPQPGYTIPQGGNADADALAMDVLQKYGSYLLYDFDTIDVAWTQVNTSTLGDATYRYVVPQKGETLGDFAKVIRQEVLDRYSDDFLKRALPKRIFLCDSLLLHEVIGSFWDGVEIWKDIPARYLDNQIAVSRPKPSWKEMNPDEQREWMHYVNSTLLEYSYDAGQIKISDEFFAISDYNMSMGSGSPTASIRRMGFIRNDKTNEDWAKNSYSLSPAADVASYIAAVVYRSAEDWESDLRYEKVARKYELIKESLITSGINIDLLQK